MPNPPAKKFLVQQLYPSNNWVTEEECRDLAEARSEVLQYRRANRGRTRLRIRTVQS